MIDFGWNQCITGYKQLALILGFTILGYVLGVLVMLEFNNNKKSKQGERLK